MRYCSFMNITMKNVVFVNQHGKMCPLDNFFVLARNVKYIHIPKEVSVLFHFIRCIKLLKLIEIEKLAESSFLSVF